MAQFSGDTGCGGREKGNAVCQAAVSTLCATKKAPLDMKDLHGGAQIVAVAKGYTINRCPPSDRFLITHWRCTMKKIYAVAAGLVAGVALAVAAVTYAQPFSGMGTGAGLGMGMGPAHGRMAGVDHANIVDSRLADLKTQLNITTAQDAAWQAFADAAKQQVTGMQAMRAQMQAESGTAPERMAQRASAMQQRAEGMTSMSKALGGLYAVLTPEQKTIADQHFGTMGPHGRHSGPRAG